MKIKPSKELAACLYLQQLWQHLHIIVLLENTETLWWQPEELPARWLITGCFRMRGLIEKSFSDSKAYLLSSSSTPVFFSFSSLWWYLGTLIGWLRVNTGECRRQSGRWVLRNRPRKQPCIHAYLWLALWTERLVAISTVQHWICQMYSLFCVRLPSICYVRV